MIICVNFLSDPFVDFLFNDNFLYYFKSLFAKFILYLDYSLNIFVFRISLEWLLLPNLRRCLRIYYLNFQIQHVIHQYNIIHYHLYLLLKNFLRIHSKIHQEKRPQNFTMMILLRLRSLLILRILFQVTDLIYHFISICQMPLFSLAYPQLQLIF